VFWTLRRKMLAGYGITLAFAVVVLAVGLVNLFRLGQASDAILRENYRSIFAAENMIGAAQRHNSALLLLALGEPGDLAGHMAREESDFRLWLRRARDNVTIKGEAALIEQIAQQHAAYLQAVESFLQVLRDRPGDAMRVHRELVGPQLARLRETCEALHELNKITMAGASDRAKRVARVAIGSMTLVGLGSVVIGITSSLMLSAWIVRPVRQLIEATRQIAAGNYEVTLRATSRDEVGGLAESFNLMVTKLRAYRDLNVQQIVAEKRKSETILRNIDDGVLVVDERRRVTSVNPAAAEVLGLADEATEGKPLEEVFAHPDLCRYVEQTLATGRAPTVEENKTYLSLPIGGREMHYQFAVAPMQTAGQTMPGALILLRNVTKLRELNRLKDEFVMTASHELRTPLTSIGMSINLLWEKAASLSEGERELLRVAQEEVERLKALVNELLDLSRIETGKIELTVSRVPAGSLVADAVAALRPQAEERGIELTCELEDDLPSVLVDAAKMTSVLTNLIGNALRYTDRGGHVCVSAEAAGKWVHLYVRDDGVGIPYEDQARIFDRFVQLSGARAGGGAGLGLAIAKETVRALRGAIWVESDPGRGSVFIVALPSVTPRPAGEKS